MYRFTFFLLVLIAGCAKSDLDVSRYAINEQTFDVAAANCMDVENLDWLSDLIKRAEEDIAYKGSIYLINLKEQRVFLHQPWVSSCFGCLLYNCNGEVVTLTEADRSEVIARVLDENLIYTSFQ
ncbi:MAG: hypothetical protein WKF87_06160 [Chryseolinea sp.]